MIETDNFYNAGFGWACKHCERDAVGKETDKENSGTNLNRIMTEGEAESKQPRLSNPALAKWNDAARTSLACPQCGLIEQVEKF
jgi:hypothetical protein